MTQVDYVVASERFAKEYGGGSAEAGLAQLATVAPMWSSPWAIAA
ncbi:MAG: hypothetical protein R2932_43335 [Caldilineaceae bacterium]